MWSTTTTKVGTKLGGHVDRVCLIRPTLLCGVGSHGEVLWDTEQETPIHRRRTGGHPVHGLVASADGRAVWLDGSSHAWVIDPDHPSGYMQLMLRSTGEEQSPGEAITALGITTGGRCVLAAADGAVGWTNRALRMADERFPTLEGQATTPVCVAGDKQWIYVLHTGGRLHRFLIEQPNDDEAEPLPEAEATDLDRPATCLAMLPKGELAFGGPLGEHLGQIWRRPVASLDWTPLRLSRRRQAQAAALEQETKQPAFVATRSKLEGPALSQLSVDDVIGAEVRYYVTHGHGSLLDRPVARGTAVEARPADALLVPAMVRLAEGTARPALLLWAGTAEQGQEPPPRDWLVWGDRPRGWTPLHTPAIREQGWSRRQVFPLEAALASPPPDVPGTRRAIPESWIDRERFDSLARECKKLLKVLW
jgi:hypothetical protein